MFNPIPNHVEQALSRLIQQYKTAENLKSLLTAIVGPIQTIEDELGLMNTLRYLPDAEGVQLDNIGMIVGIARTPGQSDADYLQAIYGQIAINVSEGTPEQIIAAFNIMTNSDFTILTEFLCSVIFSSTWVPANQEEVDTVITNLMRATPAGVRVDGIIEFDATDSFAYAGITPALGYDDGSQTVGGKYPRLHQFIGGGFAYAGDDETGLGYGSLQDPLVGGVYLT